MHIAWHVKRPTSSTVKRIAAARAGNEQISMRAAGSEPGRRRANKATPANQVYAATDLGEHSSSEERDFVLLYVAGCHRLSTNEKNSSRKKTRVGFLFESTTFLI